MSAPFGPSPTLRKYLDWATDKAGCQLREGHLGNTSLKKLESPDGRTVHLVDYSDDEVLSHSVVANLDRRLGLDSPFPKTPQPYRDHD